MCVVTLYPPLGLHRRCGRTNVAEEAGWKVLNAHRHQSSVKESTGNKDEESVYIRDREGLGTCPPTAGRGGVCEYIPPGIGRGGVIPSGIGAMDFLCGVFLGSYKPSELDARWAKRYGRAGRTGWSYRSNSF